MTPKQKLGKFILERRKKLGFSQVKLSQALDISQPKISKLEIGADHIDVSFQEFHALSKILKFNPGKVLKEVCNE